jgi:hypothetical protein
MSGCRKSTVPTCGTFEEAQIQIDRIHKAVEAPLRSR